MSSEIVRVESEYSYAQAHRKAVKHPAYYEEGLLLDVADRIIAAMDNKGVSRAELARRLKVSPAYVTKLLRGHANLSLESLAKVAFVLDLKWECIPIPLGSRLGGFTMTDEDGQAAIRTVETATIERYSSHDTDDDASAYDKGNSYELLLSA